MQEKYREIEKYVRRLLRGLGYNSDKLPCIAVAIGEDVNVSSTSDKTGFCVNSLREALDVLLQDVSTVPPAAGPESKRPKLVVCLECDSLY